MANNYKIVYGKQKLTLFYYSNGSIFKITYNGTTPSLPTAVAENVRGDFSICNEFTKNPYLICSDSQGSVYFCRQREGLWDRRCVAEKTSAAQNPQNFRLLKFDNELFIFYSIPQPNSRYHQLFLLRHINGQWEAPVSIDSFLPFSKKGFFVTPCTKSNICLTYRANNYSIQTKSLNLTSMEEISAPLFPSGVQCKDISFLPSDNRLHAVAIISNAFFDQLVYKSKGRSAYNSPLTLLEHQALDSCNIVQKGAALWVFAQSGNRIFYTVSEDYGQTFAPPAIYMESFPDDAVKADFYLDKVSGLYALEGYIQYSTNTILLLPDLDNSFYAMTKPSVKELSAAQDKTDTLKNKLSMAEKEIASKQMQLQQLTNDLTQRSDELIEINARWRIKVNALTAENEKLKKKLDTYVEECIKLRNTLAIEHLKEKESKKELVPETEPLEQEEGSTD